MVLIRNYSKTVYVLLKKEMMGYFNSPIAYVFLFFFLIIGNWLFFNSFFVLGQISMRNYFSILPWIFMFVSPAITMRVWSEEKRTKTIESLLTLPVTDFQVVVAKFLGSLFFLVFALLLTLTIPLSLSRIGDLDFGPVWGGYLAAIFLGAAYLSMGLFVSSLTKNQIISFLGSLVLSFIFFLLGSEFFLINISSSSAIIFKMIGLGSHFENSAKGIIDSRDIIFYLSFVSLFLWLNTQIIRERNWK